MRLFTSTQGASSVTALTNNNTRQFRDKAHNNAIMGKLAPFIVNEVLYAKKIIGF